MDVRQVGTVDLGRGLILKNVFYSPHFKCNLIFVHQLAWDEDCILINSAQFCLIYDFISMKPIGAGKPRSGVYYLKKSAGGKALAATQLQDCEIWHQWLGHPSMGSLSYLSETFGFKLNKHFNGCCDVCHRAKQTRNSFTLSESHAL